VPRNSLVSPRTLIASLVTASFCQSLALDRHLT
jgi:hypothetical protein